MLGGREGVNVKAEFVWLGPASRLFRMLFIYFSIINTS